LQKINVLNIDNTLFEELSGKKGRFFELIAEIEFYIVKIKEEEAR
jgi:hypothetical protein